MPPSTSTSESQEAVAIAAGLPVGSRSSQCRARGERCVVIQGSYSVLVRLLAGATAGGTASLSRARAGGLAAVLAHEFMAPAATRATFSSHVSRQSSGARAADVSQLSVGSREPGEKTTRAR